MNGKEKVLYQQIHPAKLATDFGTALVAAALLWRHRFGAAMAVGFLPSIVVTVGLVRSGHLEGLKDSRLGRYIRLYMTRGVEAVRFAGVGVFWVAAWGHWPFLMALGFVTVLLAWARGLIWPQSRQSRPG